MFDLAIQGGTVINADGRCKANVGVSEGRIVALSAEPLKAKRVIDASDCWVLPGVVDAHVHFDLSQGQGADADRTCDDYVSGPRSAALGGVTTFIDFAIQKQGRRAMEEIRSRIARAAEGSCIDFSFHGGLTNANQSTLDEVASLVDLGVTSFKIFMAYKKWGFGVDLGFVMQVMREAARCGAMICVHAENDEIIESSRAYYHELGHREMIYHSLSRPPVSEEIAMLDVLLAARETRCAVYFVHVTTEGGLKEIAKYRRHGLSVFAETCPHYLAFNDSVYAGEDGVMYTMTPPLRPPGHSEALWHGVVGGDIDVVASDHNSFSAKLKHKATGFFDVAPGLSGTATLFPYLFTHGVDAGRISPERLVALLSTHPARIYRVPNKGKVAIGYDADLLVVDPRKTFTARAADLMMGEGYTIFEGQQMKGRPLFTCCRGEAVVEEGRFVGEAGRGRFLKRLPVS